MGELTWPVLCKAKIDGENQSEPAWGRGRRWGRAPRRCGWCRRRGRPSSRAGSDAPCSQSTDRPDPSLSSPTKSQNEANVTIKSTWNPTLRRWPPEVRPTRGYFGLSHRNETKDDLWFCRAGSRAGWGGRRRSRPGALPDCGRRCGTAEIMFFWPKNKQTN